MPLIENTSLLINENIYDNCTRYDGFEEWLERQDKFDFILIDGPNDGIPDNVNNLKYARIQLIDFILLDKLNDNCFVLYHDSERDIAQNTLNEFENLLKTNGFSFQKEDIIETDEKIINHNKNILGVCPILTIYKINRERYTC